MVLAACILIFGSQPHKCAATVSPLAHGPFISSCVICQNRHRQDESVVVQVRNGLQAAAEACGVHIVTGAKVVEICSNGSRVSGIKLASGQSVAADVVLANRWGLAWLAEVVRGVSKAAPELVMAPLRPAGTCQQPMASSRMGMASSSSPSSARRPSALESLASTGASPGNCTSCAITMYFSVVRKHWQCAAVFSIMFGLNRVTAHAAASQSTGIICAKCTASPSDNFNSDLVQKTMSSPGSEQLSFSSIPTSTFTAPVPQIPLQLQRAATPSRSYCR